MKIVFFVQSEGRGHISQAIAMKKIFEKEGHEVSHVFVGKGKDIPSYISKQFDCPIYRISTPKFYKNQKNNKIDFLKTFWKNLKNRKQFFTYADAVNRYMERIKPDLIVNFYEFTIGLYNYRFKTPYPTISVGHQYLIEHPDFKFPKRNFLNKLAFKLNNKVTSYGSYKKLALSFTDQFKSTSKINVIPPVLRDAVIESSPRKGNFYLAYVVDPALIYRVIKIAAKHPDKKFKLYSTENENINLPNIDICEINADQFVKDMAKCRGYISTAGFESVCEAFYLGKPCYLFPAHYEQKCNLVDAEMAGAGINADEHTFQDFIDYSEFYKKNKEFKTWVNKFPEILIEEIKKEA